MTAPAQCGPLALETWIDDPPSLVLRPGYLDALRSLPLSGVAVMVDGPKPGLADARWSAEHLAALRDALPLHERTITLWAAPQRERIAELRREVPALLEALGSRAVDVDLEGAGQWRQSGLAGYRSLADAGAALVDALREAGAERVEVDTFPGMLGAVGGALAGADRLALQVYATASSGHSIAWTGERLRAAIRTYPHLEVVAGVAAYRQPGATDAARADHMRRALGEASQAGCKVARVWSGKWLCRLPARSYTRAALG